MTPSQLLFFIALLPPQHVRDYADEIKHHFASTYNSRHALKSPPHITLQPPFKWLLDDVPCLEENLRTFAQTQIPVPISLKGFGAFAPRVIYINVLKTPELLAIQRELITHLKDTLEIVHEDSTKRPFSPHLTVANRDLTRQNFRKAWTEFEQQTLAFEFTVPHLTLLRHDGRHWTIHEEFPLSKNPEPK